MKKVELLSPAGNMECLISAIENGADAVYIGGKKFGARAFANNFDYDELISAIKYCHLYGVKLYVTVNTICFENEIEEALDYIEFLYTNHVDALIMQDLGLITLVRKKFPYLEIHGSTQMHNHNDSGLSYLKNLGVKRVVLDREMTLNEINNLKTDIEKEVFIHGALCVSYSGCCLFSAMHGGRSGNRGECVGACRLPYKLFENDKEINTNGQYLLSTKSLCTINNIGKLIDSGITSFKIEGRMKSKEYVGYITRLYKEKINEYYLNKEYNVSDEEINNIKKLYNRELTEGYLFDNFGSTLMNIKTSNHIGTKLGTIIKIDNKKIYIKLEDTLNQEDGIRFDNDNGMIANMIYNEKGLLVNHLDKGQVCVLDNKIGLKSAKIVRKTIDFKLCQEINKYSERKVLINISCEAYIGKPLKIIVNDGINTKEVQGNIVEKANNMPTSKERIKEQLEKLGNTVFYSTSTNIDMDEDVFIPIKEINELRRTVLDKLKETREYSTSYEAVICDINTKQNKKSDNSLTISVLTRNEEQIKYSIKNRIDYIYIDNYSLYEKYKKDNVYYKTPRVTNNLNEYNNENLLVTELGGISKYSKDNKVNSDYFLNVVNSYNIKELKNIGARRVTLSPEINLESIKLIKDKSNIDLYVYGRIELMITKYCPMNMILNKDNKNCSLCLNNNYYLKDKDYNKYPLITKNHIVHILDSSNYNKLDLLDTYMDNGIYSFRIDLFDETEKEFISIMNKIRNCYEQRNNR